VDQLDRQILAELEADGRRSYREISERLRVSPGTVRSRALQLIREGAVRIVAAPNPPLMGLMFHALVALQLEPGNGDAVADLLAGRPEAGWVGLVAGGYDIIFEVALPDAQTFGRYKEEVLAKLPGCQRVDVFQVWDVRKFHYQLFPPAPGDNPADARGVLSEYHSAATDGRVRSLDTGPKRSRGR
jgi:Lrp/AsnC family transcriptional regulator for asnA, asnC and gidA